MKKILVLGIGIVLLSGCDRLAEEVAANIGGNVLGEEITTDHPDYIDTVAEMRGCTDIDPSGSVCIGILGKRVNEAIGNETLGITLAAGLNAVAVENSQSLELILEDPAYGMPARTLCAVYSDANLEFCDVALGRPTQ